MGQPPLKWTTENEREWMSALARDGKWNVIRGWLFAATNYARNWAGMDRWRLIAHAATLLAERKRKAQEEEMAEEVMVQ
jgi:hypothetical protein